jgi:hypothetical protein
MSRKSGETWGTERRGWGTRFSGHEVPGFTVFFVGTDFGLATRVDVEAHVRSEGLHGDDEPGVLGDDVGDEEIDFVGGVGSVAAVRAVDGIQHVGAVLEGAGGFDLYLPEVRCGVDDEVVMLAVAIGVGDGEAEAGGLVDESQFSKFAAALGIAIGAQALLPFVEGFLLGMHGISAHKILLFGLAVVVGPTLSQQNANREGCPA